MKPPKKTPAKTPVKYGEERGFTLVELVVVTMLLALLATILYGTLTGVMGGRSVVEARRVTHRAAEFILERIGKDLTSRSLTPLNAKNLDSESRDRASSAFGTSSLPSFMGTDKQAGEDDADRVRFVTSNAGQSSINATNNLGLVEVEYRLEPARGPSGEEAFGDAARTKILVRDEVPALVENEDMLNEKRLAVPLSRDVIALNFRYRKEGKWQNTWEDRFGLLPEAVEVTLTLKSGDDETETFRTAYAISQQRRAPQQGSQQEG